MKRPQCKKCKHYQADHNAKQGECSRIGDRNDRYSAIVPQGEALTWDYEGYSSGIYVHENFGCVLFEEKQK